MIDKLVVQISIGVKNVIIFENLYKFPLFILKLRVIHFNLQNQKS